MNPEYFPKHGFLSLSHGVPPPPEDLTNAIGWILHIVVGCMGLGLIALMFFGAIFLARFIPRVRASIRDFMADEPDE